MDKEKILHILDTIFMVNIIKGLSGFFYSVIYCLIIYSGSLIIKQYAILNLQIFPVFVISCFCVFFLEKFVHRVSCSEGMFIVPELLLVLYVVFNLIGNYGTASMFLWLAFNILLILIVVSIAYNLTRDCLYSNFCRNERKENQTKDKVGVRNG